MMGAHDAEFDERIQATKYVEGEIKLDYVICSPQCLIEFGELLMEGED